MAKRDPGTMVYMAHPDVKTTAGPVTLQALETVHAPKGWYEIEEEDRVFPEHEVDETEPRRIDNRRARERMEAKDEATPRETVASRTRPQASTGQTTTGESS